MDQKAEAWLIYDGECPFCSAYVKLLRLREAVGVIHLIDARRGGPLVAEVFATGFDLDDGMALKIGSQIYHGDDCIHALALMSSDAGWFNRFNAMVFASPGRARLLYPLLRVGRNLALRMLGRGKLAGATADRR